MEDWWGGRMMMGYMDGEEREGVMGWGGMGFDEGGGWIGKGGVDLK